MDRKIISTDKAPGAIGPYSQGVKIANLVYTSGQIPINFATGEIPEGIEAQTKQTLENVKAVLEAGGSCLKNAVKLLIFIKDINDFTKMNEVYSQFFTENYPARSCVEVSRIPKNALIEIDAIGIVE
jgi:2-iminobutanoate/2-iminopropanoate deaminase